MSKGWDPGLVLSWTVAVIVAGAFCWLLGDVFWNGLGRVNWQFLTEAPRDAGRSGGIGPIIVSTMLILLVCMAASLPLGVGAAIYLSEFTDSEVGFGRMIRRSLEVLSGVPSIVFGLFGSAFFCIYLGLGFSILAGGLTLACMVLPILIRATEEGFRSVPSEYRLGGAALGMSRTRRLLYLSFPAALPSVVVGFVLGLGRAIAETAALIFTSGYVDRMPSSLFDSGRALSIHIFDTSMNVSGGEAQAYGTAVVLVFTLLSINLAASWITDRWLYRESIGS